jgi:hypothetical protein
VSEFTFAARNADGTSDGIAALHPFSLDVHLAMNTGEGGEPAGALHGIQLDLPPGLMGNPAALPRCSSTEFDESGGLAPRCNGSTQIGILRGVVTGLGQIHLPVYNLVPAQGAAAAFGGSANGNRFIQSLTLVASGAASSIRLSGALPPEPQIVDVEEEIWGVPADPEHDAERICWSAGGSKVEGCSAGVAEKPLLTLPASCAEPMRTTLTATSLGPPVETAVVSDVSRDAGGDPWPLIGCELVPFDPKVTLQAEGAALAPTGLAVGIELPQQEAVGVTSTAPLTAFQIALPEGLTLNPAVGSWLGSCSPAAIGLESTPGIEPPVFDRSPASCPASSRLGSIELRTPLVDHELSGSIYLATPGANPFAALYAIYLAIEDEASGTILKIPGRLEADATDGRLTAIVPNMPQVPFSDLELEFAGGARAPLVSPPGCGKYSGSATLSPSTVPFEVPAQRAATFILTSGERGRPCPSPEALRNPAPAFHAGSEGPAAGGGDPFVVRISRQDADQHLGSFRLALPPGLTANLASFPAGARVGSAQVRAGVGSEPARLEGSVYLAGPYEGAPYSLETVVPARVGPFDLGTIVQRAALEIDPVTAQISVRSDPLPQILRGVPLELRSLELDFDRTGFIRNPTSCEPMAITGTATTSLGQTAPLSDRFQVGDCAALAFKPKLSLSLAGALGRNGHPGVRAVLRVDPGGAALASAAFTLSAGELLDLQHVRGLCPRDTSVSRCPRDSGLGKLRLESPFLESAVEGPVYLREPGRGLPGLIAELRSGALRFVLHGRTGSSHGRLTVRFGSLPDLPLSKAVLSLAGGRHGIVVNSHSLCSRTGTATATATAHNGMRRSLSVRPHLEGSC